MATGLVVSERASERARLGRALRGIGVNTRALGSLAEVRAEAWHLDLVVVDCKKPGSQAGFQVAQRVREARPTSGILLYEAGAASGREAACERLGVWLLPGPVRAAFLRTWARHELDGRAGARSTRPTAGSPSTQAGGPPFQVDAFWVGILCSILDWTRPPRRKPRAR